MNISKKLVKLREKNKYSIEKLSNELNIKESTILKWENGEKTPNIFMLNKLAKLYNVKISSIIEEENIVSLLLKNIKKNYIKSVLLFILVLIILFFSYIFYINRDVTEINIYNFSGESDNFKFKKGLVVLSDDNKYIELSNFETKNNIKLKSMTINVAFNEKIWVVKEFDNEDISIDRWFSNLKIDEYYKEGFSLYKNQNDNSFANYSNKFPNDFKIEINYCTIDDNCTVEILDIKAEKLNTKSKIKKFKKN